MSISLQKTNPGTIIFILLLILAGVIYCSNLAFIPLTIHEAPFALAALEASGNSYYYADALPIAAVSPLYQLGTGFLFDIFGAGDALTRLLPAWSGVAFLLVPWLLRRVWGVDWAIIYGVLIITSPLTVATARTADPAMMAATSLLLGGLLITCRYWSAFKDQDSNRRQIAGALLLAAALLCGRTFYFGVLGLLAGGLLVLATVSNAERSVYAARAAETIANGWMLFIVAALLMTTGFGFRVENVTQLFNSFGEWISGWQVASGYTFSRMLASLIFLEPWFVLGLIGVLFALRKRSRTDLFLLGWTAGSGILLLLYPGRVRTDIIWLILPLLGFAANLIRDLLAWITAAVQERSWLDLAGLLVVLYSLGGFIYLQFASFSSSTTLITDPAAISNLGLGIAAIIVSLVVILFYGFGWGWRVAWEATFQAGTLLLLFLSISSLVKINFGKNADSAVQLWRANTTQPELYATVQMFETLSLAAMGEKHNLTIQIHGETNPALVWALRDFPDFKPETGELNSAAVQMVPVAAEQPALAVEYAGLTVSLFESQGWPGVLPPDIIKWRFKEQAPLINENWLVLVRSDMLLKDAVLDFEDPDTISE